MIDIIRSEVIGQGQAIAAIERDSFEREVLVKSQKGIADRFTPEFLGRLDDVVIFNPIPLDVVDLIVKKMLLNIFPKLEKAQNIVIEIDPSVYSAFTAQFNKSLGARALRRLIETELTSVFTHEIPNGSRVTLIATHGTLSVKHTATESQPQNATLLKAM